MIKRNKSSNKNCVRIWSSLNQNNDSLQVGTAKCNDLIIIKCLKNYASSRHSSIPVDDFDDTYIHNRIY